MESNIFERFEKQVGSLIKNYEKVKRDNVTLHEKQHALIAERDALEKKHKRITDNLEKLLIRLQEFEHGDDTE